LARKDQTKRSQLAVTLFALTIASLALAACGRRGDPEPPPSAAVVTTDEQGRPVKSNQAPVNDRPFILDALIQ
jgi:predicted small lipoprotein YifL